MAYPQPNIPYEDHHQTKEIIRMYMVQLSIALQNAMGIKELHHLLNEIEKTMDKLHDEDISSTFHQLRSLIEHNFPINQNTKWEVLQNIGSCFSYIDRKTIF